MQIEAAVEPVGEGGEVVGGVFAVIERVVGTCQRPLEIAQNGVDPSELGQLAWFAVTDDGRHMHATGINDCREAGQAVTGDHGARCQMDLRPLLDGIEREAGHQRELEVHRVAHLVERDRCNERHLVLGAATGRAAAELAAEVGIVHLHDIGELMREVAAEFQTPG